MLNSLKGRCRVVVSYSNLKEELRVFLLATLEIPTFPSPDWSLGNHSTVRPSEGHRGRWGLWIWVRLTDLMTELKSLVGEIRSCKLHSASKRGKKKGKEFINLL